MDPSSAQHQDMGINASQENLLISPKSATTQPERKPRPTPEAVLRCPRCDSTNTKFCYYNNYSLSQPRYFCKSCRRYWTKGGTLRNVPVGGGCRKNKRPSSSSSSKRSQDHHPLGMMHTPTNPNPHNPLSSLSSLASYDSPNFDLSLAFARLHNNKQLLPEFDHLSIFGNPSSGNLSTPSHDVLGNPIHGGYFENNNIQGSGGFHCNMYSYGLGNGEIESAGISEEMGGFPNYDQEMSCGAATTPTTSTAVTVTPMKQELCNGDEGDHHNRALWGFPWQNIVGSNTGDGNDMGDVELPGRESWNGITSSWHGLLNSPLM